MRNNLLMLSLVVLVFAFALNVLKDYLALPVVAKDYDNECVWIKQAPDYKKQDCPAVLPSKYHVERVK